MSTQKPDKPSSTIPKAPLFDPPAMIRLPVSAKATSTLPPSVAVTPAQQPGETGFIIPSLPRQQYFPSALATSTQKLEQPRPALPRVPPFWPPPIPSLPASGKATSALSPCAAVMPAQRNDLSTTSTTFPLASHLPAPNPNGASPTVPRRIPTNGPESERRARVERWIKSSATITAANEAHCQHPYDLDELKRDTAVAIAAFPTGCAATPFDPDNQVELRDLLDLQTILVTQRLSQKQFDQVRQLVSQLLETARTPEPS